MKLKTQILAIALGLAASTPLVWSADRQASPEATPPLVGVWQLVRHGVDCNTGEDLSSFPALMTFHRDGTLHGDAVAPGATAAQGTAEHGVWQREPGSQNYSFRDVGYNWDPDTGAFEGSGVITASVHLTSPTTFAYTATIQFFDPDGNLLFTICGRATGERFQ